MATAKKTGIVDKVKDAISGFFSSDAKRSTPKVAEKPVPAKKASTGTAVKKTAKKATTGARTAVKKAAGAAKKATAKKR